MIFIQKLNRIHLFFKNLDSWINICSFNFLTSFDIESKNTKLGETSDLFLIQHSGDETGKKLHTVTDNSVSLAY